MNYLFLILTIFIILILFFYFSKSAFISGNAIYTTYSCTDSDGGKNYTTTGIVNYTNLFSKQSLKDKCSSNHNLIEYFCQNNKISFTNYNCGTDNVCVGGKCQKKQCKYSQPYPNPQNSSYNGDHGDSGNQDRQFCDGPEFAPKLNWSVIDGTVVFQPISVSANGTQLYATIMHTDIPTLYAIDTKSGKINWSRDYSASAAFVTPLSDETGYVYLVGKKKTSLENVTSIFCLYPNGTEKWETPLKVNSTEIVAGRAPGGIHFTASGKIATVTNDGLIFILERNGRIVSVYNIPQKLGFVTPKSSGSNTSKNSFSSINDKKVNDKNNSRGIMARFEKILGSGATSILSVLDTSYYCDNTIAVSLKNQLFVIGGGTDENTSALIAFNFNDLTNSIEFTWYMPFNGDSGTSPSINRNGDALAIEGGVENNVDMFYINIDKCNKNIDSDSRPEICKESWKYHYLGSGSGGSLGFDENGVVYFWDSSLKPEDPDFYAIADSNGTPKVLWKKSYANSNLNVQFTSLATVLNNEILGTITTFDPLINTGSLYTLYKSSKDELVGIDRYTGEILWRTYADDDSINAPIVGTDGDIYLPYFGMADIVSLNASEFHGGIRKYIV